MVKHLPAYERKNQLINEIIKATAIELNKLDIKTEENYAELFIDTAIKVLAIHERDLGIEKGALTDIQRRELITARYRVMLEQTTEETIKNVASAFSNGEVEINSTDTPGVYEIKFVGTIGIPDNMEGLISTLDIVIPAHLDVIYTYVYNTWDDIGNLTWNELETYTWNQVFEEEVV